MHRGPAAWAVERLMDRALTRAFHRILWHGPVPAVPPGRSVVLLVNHPTFYDGYAGGLVVRRVLGRRPLTWMREWDRFPFFAAAGALPFPEGDPVDRAATVRRTARLLAAPGYGLVYFPEGDLHSPDEPLRPFDAAFLARLGRLFPPVTWLPVALHPTWEAADHPVLRIAAGVPQDGVDGGERDRIAAVRDALRTAPGDGRVLLGRGRSTQDAWDFRFARGFFRRFL